MVDFQSRDTRRGIGGNDDDEEDETDGQTKTNGQTETDEPAQQEANDATAQNEESADRQPSESSPQQMDDPVAPAGDETAPETATGPRETAETDPQADQPAASKSVTSAAEPDSEPHASTVSVDVAVVTVGTSTGQGTDPTGEQLRAALEAAGHTVSARERLRGEYDSIQQSVDTLVGRDDVDVVVTAGGTGIKPEETTIEAVHPLFEKALPGFGEAFRTLLFDLIGTGIVAVRSTAGIADGTPVFCLPGDEQAAVLAIEEIIATEAGELVEHLR